MKRYRLIVWWKLIVIDIIVFAIVLCTFCYFHHVRDMWVLAGDDNPIESTLGVFTRPPKTTPQVSQKPPVTSGTSGTGEVTTAPPPPVIDEGDFGAKFPGVFLEEGEPIISQEDRYVSHDINITYRKSTIQISGHDVMYHYFDVYIRNIENFYTVPITGTSRKTLDALEKMGSELTDENGELINDGPPILSMNGDYWRHNKVLLAERNGVLYSQSEYINNDIGILYYDGSFEVVSPDMYNWQQIANKAPYQIWYFGPGLLNEDGSPRGENANDYKTDGASYNSILGGRNPRAAIGYYEPGHYAFVVVDGRSSESYGINIPNFAKIMSQLGCTAAYNLDGGNSAQIKFNGEYKRKGDQNASQRSLDDILCIGEVIKKD